MKGRSKPVCFSWWWPSKGLEASDQFRLPFLRRGTPPSTSVNNSWRSFCLSRASLTSLPCLLIANTVCGSKLLLPDLSSVTVQWCYCGLGDILRLTGWKYHKYWVKIAPFASSWESKTRIWREKSCRKRSILWLPKLQNIPTYTNLCRYPY